MDRLYLLNYNKLEKHLGKWFLFYGDNNENFLLSPSNPMFDSIWEGVSKMLRVCEDDCGSNLNVCAQLCDEASKLFAGASQLCSDMAKYNREQYELQIVYAPDPDEPWYNK